MESGSSPIERDRCNAIPEALQKKMFLNEVVIKRLAHYKQVAMQAEVLSSQLGSMVATYVVT